jgi:hypothetical protein
MTRPKFAVEQYFGRLQVSVDQALAVGVTQGIPNLLQQGRHLGLALEPLQGSGNLHHVCTEQLQRMAFPHKLVLHLVYLPHPAATKQTHDAVLAERRTGLESVGIVGHGVEKFREK